MFKNFKIILILLAVVITVILILVVVLSQNPENNFLEKIGDKENSEEKVDLAALSEEYKEGISEALAEFSDLSETSELNVPRIEEIKNKVLNLKLPPEFKNLHLNFILAMARMEDYLSTGAEEAKLTAVDMIEKIKSDYPWAYNSTSN